jgi:FecR protein
MTEALDRITHLLRAEADSEAGPSAPEVSALNRERAIRVIEEALRAKREQKAKRTWYVGGSVAGSLALAAAAALWIVTARKETANAELAHVSQASGAMFADNAPLKLGDVLREGAAIHSISDAEFQYTSGTLVHLDPGSHVGLTSQGKAKSFVVSEGTLTAHVAKLKTDERFLVRTVDTEVEVRGTIFAVTVVPADSQCGGSASASLTRVNVTEGVVVVRNEGKSVTLRAGDHWPNCEAKAAAIEVRTKEGASFSDLPKAKPGVGGALQAPSPEAHSTLATQNDLFADAMQKKRAGNTQGALEALGRLTREFPKGPLLESASAERMRILATAGSAREYLRRYPEGFAKAEAEALLK